MKLVSKLFFTLTIMIFSLKYVKNESQNSKFNMIMLRSFGIGPIKLFDLIEKEIKEEKLMREEKLRKQQVEIEEKQRKKMMKLVIPLTRGNSFMRDFYSGRY